MGGGSYARCKQEVHWGVFVKRGAICWTRTRMPTPRTERLEMHQGSNQGLKPGYRADVGGHSRAFPAVSRGLRFRK